MIEAWLSASEMIASSSPSSGSNRPPLASKQAAYRMVSSVPKNCGDLRFQLLVQVLRAADEAHRGHAEAVRVQRLLGGGDHVRVVGQAQVVVGAEVEHLAAAFQLDLGRLRRDDDALGLEQALLADGVEFAGVARLGWIAHGMSDRWMAKRRL